MSVGSFIRGGLIASALLAALAQIAIDPSIDNLVSDCIVLSSSLGILLYMHWSDALRTHPLSVFVIFGFCMTTQLGALLIQTAYWTPLKFSLHDPTYTFGTLALYQAIALGVHVIYCFFSTPSDSKNSWARGTLRRAGLYEFPSAISLWIMGGIGVTGFFFASRNGLISKIGLGSSFLIWAPFLIPFYRKEARSDLTPIRHLVILLTLYCMLIALLAVASNGRGMVFKGVLTVSLLYLLQGLRSATVVKSRPVLMLAITVLVAAIALQPLGQLVAAMGAARASRGKISPIEMIAKTYDFLLHPELIRVSQGADADAPSYVRPYDEIYIKSSLFGRFVETKFHDNALYFGRSIVTDDSQQRLRQVTEDTLLADLPRPLLQAVDLDVDKRTLLFSMGDYLFYLARGGAPAGFKTGSVFGQGIALLGSIFPIIYAIACFAIFHWLRLLTSLGRGEALLSAVAMMNIWPLFQYGITAESLADLCGLIVREVPQWIVIYLIVLLAVRFVFGKRHLQAQS